MRPHILSRLAIATLAVVLFAVHSNRLRAANETYEVTLGEVYADRQSGPLRADLYVPHDVGPHPGVLVVHGGAWRMGSRAQLAGAARLLAEQGFTAVAISYRLAPEHKFPAQIEDCKEAVRWMRTNAAKWKIDSNRIGAFGYSAGAQLVTLLATTDTHDGLEFVADPAKAPSTRLQAVAAGGAPCEFRNFRPEVRFLEFWLGGSRAECPEQYRLASPRAFVTPDDPPMFFFHGGNDLMVPLMSPERMRESLSNAGVESELYIAPDLGHIATSVDRESIDRAIVFLKAHLQGDEDGNSPHLHTAAKP